MHILCATRPPARTSQASHHLINAIDEPLYMTVSFAEETEYIQQTRKICFQLAGHVLRYPPNMTILEHSAHTAYDEECLVSLPVRLPLESCFAMNDQSS